MSDKFDNYSNIVEESLSLVSNRNEFIQKMKKLVQNMGFSDFDISQTGCNPNLHLILSTLPEGIHETYKRESLHECDLVLEYLSHSDQPIFDAAAYKHYRDSPYPIPSFAKCARPYEMMKGFGYNNSFTMPITIRNKIRLIFSVLTEGMEEDKFVFHTNNYLSRLNILAKLSCQILTQSNFSNNIKKNQTLSQRHLEILELIAKQGKTHKEVAAICNLSPRTVSNHVEEIKFRLGASNFPHAIFIAMNRGILKREF